MNETTAWVPCHTRATEIPWTSIRWAFKKLLSLLDHTCWANQFPADRGHVHRLDPFAGSIIILRVNADIPCCEVPVGIYACMTTSRHSVASLTRVPEGKGHMLRSQHVELTGCEKCRRSHPQNTPRHQRVTTTKAFWTLQSNAEQRLIMWLF